MSFVDYHDVLINKETFRVNKSEFTKVDNDEYATLNILNDLGEFERVIALLRDIAILIPLEKRTIGFSGTSHGGFIPIMMSRSGYSQVQVAGGKDLSFLNNMLHNLNALAVKNVRVKEKLEEPDVVVISPWEKIDESVLLTNPIVLSTKPVIKDGTEIYKLSRTNWFLTIPEKYMQEFKNNFSYYITSQGELDYDNLIHLSMIVKNGGKDFEEMLLKNFHLIDQWTILDTGSTDNTIEIINRVLVGKKKGKLFQEPFINFRESRNRALDLSGTSCKFILTLDDTYIVDGDLRNFLTTVRGDQNASSFSLFVKSHDVEYSSNRIIKSELCLRYIYTIHEVIQTENNLNVGIPKYISIINDMKSDYMQDRTMKRKELDLKLLSEMIQEEPNNPRHLYYMAQTYNILNRYQEATEYFMKRVNHPVEGYIQERVDSYFEAARNYNFHLGRPWSECEELYKKAYELDTTRPDSLYFMGIHYLNGNDRQKGFELMKKAYEVGYPIASQHSLKPTLSFHFVPRFLMDLCYEFKDYILGQNAAELFLKNNGSDADYHKVMVSWHNIFAYLNRMAPLARNPQNPSKPLVCFVADGGFAPWTGKDILDKGVGGSETFIIEIARYVQKSGEYDCVVFCNCPEESVFEGVKYLHLKSFFSFVRNIRVHTCMISRFSEYLPVAYDGHVENIYLILHDLMPSGWVIPRKDKLRRIFCLSEWHVNYFTNTFTTLKDITVPFNYGIDFANFLPPTELQIGPKGNDMEVKIKNSFIYSSFPNRGLLPLLQMWPKVVAKFPTSVLNMHCDLNGRWVNEVYPEGIKEIKRLLAEYNSDPLISQSLKYHGWTDKKTLARSWLCSDIWFYPCIFQETFCLTALESALTKTFAITSELAALQDTVGDRGVMIRGDPLTKEWQEVALNILFQIMSDRQSTLKKNLVEKNYNWARKMSWESRAKTFITEYLNLPLEYCGMYNWTNDLPSGHRKIFLEVLDYFNSTHKQSNSIRVLEVGVYSGTSLIEIMRTLPRTATALAVDKWENYEENGTDTANVIVENGIESTFHRNIQRSGLVDRVSAIKGDSHETLLKFIENQETFDFIYVDGNHTCLHCYMDLILAWKLLNKGGILAIDDYLFGSENNVLDRPKEAVDYFMKLYEGKYKVLSKTYRVFLEKC